MRAGCFECAKRRIHCDRAVPECNKCLKKGIACSGLANRYAFRNETVLWEAGPGGTAIRPCRAYVRPVHSPTWALADPRSKTDPSTALISVYSPGAKWLGRADVRHGTATPDDESTARLTEAQLRSNDISADSDEIEECVLRANPLPQMVRSRPNPRADLRLDHVEQNFFLSHCQCLAPHPAMECLTQR